MPLKYASIDINRPGRRIKSHTITKTYTYYKIALDQHLISKSHGGEIQGDTPMYGGLDGLDQNDQGNGTRPVRNPGIYGFRVKSNQRILNQSVTEKPPVSTAKPAVCINRPIDTWSLNKSVRQFDQQVKYRGS
jgi:hypothetical protein